jgi:hypothetical protein
MSEGDWLAAIANFEAPDEHAKAVLARLASEEWKGHVLPAWKTVRSKDWNVLLRDCVEAERLMREHKSRVAVLQRQFAAAGEAAEALTIVAKYGEP